MQSKVTEKAIRSNPLRYAVVSKLPSGYESSVYVEHDDFARVNVGDTIEILISVIPAEVF